MCALCQGQGFIIRDSHTRKIVRQKYEGYRLGDATESVTVETGGVDACPRCRLRSEIEYVLYSKGKDHEQSTQHAVFR